MIFNATDSRSYRKFGIFQKETFSSAYCFAKGRARVSILLSRQREGLTKQRVPSKKGDSIKRLPLARYFIYSNRADYLSAGSTRHALFLDTSISIQRSKQYPSVLSLSVFVIITIIVIVQSPTNFSRRDFHGSIMTNRKPKRETKCKRQAPRGLTCNQSFRRTVTRVLIRLIRKLENQGYSGFVLCGTQAHETYIDEFYETYREYQMEHSKISSTKVEQRDTIIMVTIANSQKQIYLVHLNSHFVTLYQHLRSHSRNSHLQNLIFPFYLGETNFQIFKYHSKH